MNKFKIGDKVETPFGVGEITFIHEDDIPMEEDTCWVIVYNRGEYDFQRNELKPYKTAHDKLLELGFGYSGAYEYTAYEFCHYIRKEPKQSFENIYINKTKKTVYADFYINVELSKILTQYLEELEDGL